MPQDRLRSVVYRSFLTCDDPKGVVECRTMRKSKTHSKKMESNVETRGIQNLNTSSLKIEKRKDKVTNKMSKEQLHNPSSIQLMEVSRGAHKLNQVVDSLSKRTSFDDKSNDIAKDLLRGALDLQESLIMLGKLQEASQYMARLKKKQKEKAGGEMVEQVRIERTNSDRDQIYPMEYQKPRLSADSSSRDCYEELRKVIRDGLARQNLLPNISSEEKFYFDRKKLDSSPEIPSVTSSQSFVDHSHEFASSDCYEELRKVIGDGLAQRNLLPNSSSEEKFYRNRKKLDLTLDIPSISSSQSSTDHSLEFTSSDSLSSKIQQEKPKGLNLIAKLMGLEEITPNPLQHSSLTERDKIFSQRRLIFDMDVPKIRKPRFAVPKVDPELRTLEEIIETVQFKGLLKRKSGDVLKHQTRHSNACDLRKRFVDDAPPIVLIKPLNVPYLEEAELHSNKFIHDEAVLDTEEKLRKWKIKEEVPPETIDHQEASLNSHEMLRKPEVEKTTIKSVIPKKGGKDRKDVTAKPDDRKVKTKELPSSAKLKNYVHVNAELQKEEPIDKRVDKIRKAANSGRKPAEMQNVKSKGVFQYPDQGKVTSTKVRRPESKSCISRNQTPHPKNTTSNTTVKRATTASRNSSIPKKNVKNEKPVTGPLTANVENIVCQDGNMQIDLNGENESCIAVSSSTPEVQLLTEEGTDASEVPTEENCNNNHNSPCEVSLLTTQHTNTTIGEADYCITHYVTETRSDQNRSNTRDLLLSSAAFISHAEELFDINACKPLILQATLHDCAIVTTRILLDIADELLEIKSQRSIRIIHPLLQNPSRNSRIAISLDRLVEEICEEIESSSRLAGSRLPVDNLNVVLERDLWCKGVVSGGWDMGWRNGFTSDEVEQVVGDIEKVVISGLIEELLMNFVL